MKKTSNRIIRLRLLKLGRSEQFIRWAFCLMKLYANGDPNGKWDRWNEAEGFWVVLMDLKTLHREGLINLPLRPYEEDRFD